nr:hypothetical protein GCM10020185_39550 [Pseudomonas brassicacearum subsp. brassicacearum]
MFCDNKSSDILGLLLDECDQAGVSLHLDTSITQIERTDSGYLLQTTLGALACQSLVIATGGLSIPTLGATGFGYQVAKQFGHELLPTRAGLVPFTITDQLKTLCTELSGTSVDCLVSCNDQSFRENILFTHRGLSGPAILQISSFWESGDTVQINLLPDHDVPQWLQQQQAERPNSELKTLLGELFTKKNGQPVGGHLVRVQTHEAIHPCGAGRHRRKKLASWNVVPAGTEGYRTAEVTLGGVDTREVSSKTMESLKKPRAVFHRRSAGRHRAPGRVQLPVGVGVGVCGGAIRLTRHDSNAGNNPVGASLLAKAVCQPLLNCLIHRYREQARSHRGSGYTPEHFFCCQM